MICLYIYVLSEPQPKDFSKDNVRRMRQIQSKSRNKQREEVVEKNKPMKVLPQSEKYKVVASKVTENLKVSPASLYMYCTTKFSFSYYCALMCVFSVCAFFHLRMVTCMFVTRFQTSMLICFS